MNGENPSQPDPAFPGFALHIPAVDVSPILSEEGQNTIAELSINVEINYMKRVAFRIFALVGY